MTTYGEATTLPALPQRQAPQPKGAQLDSESAESGSQVSYRSSTRGIPC